MLSTLGGMPSITGGNAKSYSDGLFEGSEFQTSWTSPFIFGGSGKGVNTALTGYVVAGVLVVVFLVGLMAWRTVRK